MKLNSVSFKGSYLIPYSEFRGSYGHEKMREIGKETAQFTDMQNMQQTKSGILVNIDDSREKEYLAIVAKYGVNLRKSDTPAIGNKPDSISYKFMMSKLNPEIAEEETKRFEKMPEGDYKNKMYIDLYSKFKNSPYSTERI